MKPEDEEGTVKPEDGEGTVKTEDGEGTAKPEDREETVMKHDVMKHSHSCTIHTSKLLNLQMRDIGEKGGPVAFIARCMWMWPNLPAGGA